MITKKVPVSAPKKRKNRSIVVGAQDAMVDAAAAAGAVSMDVRAPPPSRTRPSRTHIEAAASEASEEMGGRRG